MCKAEACISPGGPAPLSGVVAGRACDAKYPGELVGVTMPVSISQQRSLRPCLAVSLSGTSTGCQQMPLWLLLLCC